MEGLDLDDGNCNLGLGSPAMPPSPAPAPAPPQTALTDTETIVKNEKHPTKDSSQCCTVCGLKSEKKCGACNQVYYCSSDHQKQDWKIHKKVCGPFRIEQSSASDVSLGKQWVANRDLEAGEIILDEPVCFYGPFSADANSHPARSPPWLSCIVCGLCSYTKTKRVCSSCGWPVCSVECEKAQVHIDNECSLFSASRGSGSYTQVIKEGPASELLVSLIISTIRGSHLKQKNPKVFQDVLKLQYLCDIDCSSDYQLAHAKLPQYIRSCLSKLLPQQKHLLPPETCDRLQRVILINNFIACTETQIESSITNNTTDPVAVAFGNQTKLLETETETELRYKHLIYNKASRLNHSCAPNCSYSIGPGPDFKIRVRTAIPIEINEPLTIYYPMSPHNKLQESVTSTRRYHLDRYRGFLCKCWRCKDPSELGSFISAFKCTSLKCQTNNDNNCGHDYCVPCDPLNNVGNPPGSSHQYDYPSKCLKCGTIQNGPADDANGGDCSDGGNVGRVIDKEFQALMTMLNTRSWSNVTKVVKKFKVFQDKYSGRVYHGNWNLLLDATLCFVRGLEFEIYERGTKEVKVLERHLEWVQRGLDYFGCVLPGVNLKRAQLLKHRAAVLRLKLLHHSTTMTKDQLSQTYQHFIQASQEALKFYEKDFAYPGKSTNFHAQVISLRVMQVKYEFDALINN